MAADPFAVLLICAERESASRLAAVIQARGRRVIATPYGAAALARASEARIIIVDRVEGAVTAPQVVSRIKAAPNLGAIPLLAISQRDDADERVALLDAGADDVMAHPVDPGELDARIDGLLLQLDHPGSVAEPASPAPEPSRIGPRVIGVFSPKGGAGVTTLAVNAAVTLARGSGRKVALVDLDLAWGQVATHLNLAPRFTAVELAQDIVALHDPELVRGYAERHPSGLAVFAAPSRPDITESFTQPQVTTLVAAIMTAYDVVVVDTGSVLDERALAVFDLCQRLVLVVNPDIPAVRSMHTLLEMLTEEAGPSEREFVVLNHLFAEQLLRPDDVQRSLQVTVQAEIPHDPTLYLKAVNEGVPVVIGAPRSLAAERLSRLAFRLLGEHATEALPPADSQRRLRLAGLLRRG